MYWHPHLKLLYLMTKNNEFYVGWKWWNNLWIYVPLYMLEGMLSTKQNQSKWQLNKNSACAKNNPDLLLARC